MVVGGKKRKGNRELGRKAIEYRVSAEQLLPIVADSVFRINSYCM